MTCRCAPGAGRCGRCDERVDLASQLANRNDRCAKTDEAGVCLRPKNHADNCAFESFERVIPFE